MTPPPNATAFELRAAQLVRDGRVVLQGLEFDVAAGERLALVGPSGAGKTCTLELLGGSLAPSAGAVRIAGLRPAELGERELRALRMRIGWVHQGLDLVPGYSALANVTLGRLGRRGLLDALRATLLPSQEERRAVLELLERLGVGACLHQPVERLSGGERQRVAIARALYQEPHSLLCDEPLAAVDPARSRDLLELLLGLAQERGLTLVCSLHDLELARELFPRLIGLRGGRVAFDSGPEQVTADQWRALYRIEDGPLEGPPSGAGDGA